LRLAKTSEPPPRLRDFHSLASSFKRTIFIIQGTHIEVWQKNGATECSINFCLSIKQQLAAGHYKFGDINNNELLIINLAAVPAGRISNASSSPSPGR